MADWTLDKCTCEHVVDSHKDDEGRCKECDVVSNWARGGKVCNRYQWDGAPRKRVW